ncbi:MAG TPA: hypothetical protein VF173_01115 [Thermoanaerobaculia bacterium]|nr:hypothetical protein [Thermoanaerobaculia bacterium]
MRTRWIWGLALFLLAALPAAAQEEASTEPVRFLIETVTVEGTKEAVANIVRAETLLREGASYDEEQLRLAVYRVHRLPFVLDASFSLRKGSRRGAYELVITVQPARWFFFDQWIRAFTFEHPLDLGDETFRGNNSSASIGGVAGARLFVGRSGELFGAFDSRDGLQLGFTQYDLFHRGILATAGISRELCCVTEVLPLALDPTFSSWQFDSSRKVSLGMSVPLGGRQSIQVSLSDRRGEPGSHRGVLEDTPDRVRQLFDSSGELAYQRAEAKWVYDTSDDPFLPTRGISVSAGVEAARFTSSNLRELATDPPFEFHPLAPFHSEQVVAAVSGIWHLPLSPRQTVSLMGKVFGGPSKLENLSLRDRTVAQTNVDSFGGSVGVQHSVTLRRTRTADNFMDLRLESGVEIGVEKTSPDYGPSPLKRFAAHTGLVFRNPWGRVRVDFTYLDLGEVVP